MKKKSLKIPLIILTIGLIMAIAAYLFTGIVKVPVITEHDFHFTVTYQLDGETKTHEGVYRCAFRSTGKGTDPLERYYEGTYLSNPSEYHPAAHTIAQQDGLELCIVTSFNDHYLMGDTKGIPESTFYYEPYLAVIDEEGYEYEDPETVGKFDVELLSWEPAQPVENTFVFKGFSGLHDDSMIAMMIVGLLVIAACIIFVKRDKTVPYKALDKISVILNFVIVLAAVPFFTVVGLLSQIFMGGEEFAYQMSMCVPALTAFTVAASVSLRRRGFTKSGFFLQFIGPALFVLLFI